MDRVLNYAETSDRVNQSDDLSSYSKRDEVWNIHRAEAQAVELIYSTSDEFKSYAYRMHSCSEVLHFAWVVDDNGDASLKLRETRFCRVRHCPVCQWRRALMWSARFYEALPLLQERYPGARWIFLTLTVRNCEITELRSVIKWMNKSWERLIKRRSLSHVLGWVRTIEVTKGKDRADSAHPHFHVLLMVPASWFKKHYISHSRWVRLWRECLRVDYDPSVCVKVVRGITLAELKDAAAEVLKYSVKPVDMLEDREWFFELTRQVHKLKFVAAGGVLREVLRVEDESDENLAMLSSEEKNCDVSMYSLAFSWKRNELRYKRSPELDKPLDDGEEKSTTTPKGK